MQGLLQSLLILHVNKYRFSKSFKEYCNDKEGEFSHSVDYLGKPLNLKKYLYFDMGEKSQPGQ